MSATFPLISPAASLPYASRTNRHLVDAGYYDNYGTNVAINWLRKCWLPAVLANPQDFPRKVILIELDAYPRFHETRDSEGKCGEFFLEDFQRPITALGQRRRSVAFRNDQEIESFRLFLDLLKQQPGPPLKEIEFSSFRFTNAIDASLSWTLTRFEADTLKRWAEMIVSGDPSKVTLAVTQGIPERRRVSFEQRVKDLEAARDRSIAEMKALTECWKKSHP